MSPPTFLRPGSVAEACALLARDPFETMLLAGGTAVVLMMRQGLIAPTALVSLDRVDGLRGVELAGHTLRIGAGVRLAEVAESAQVRRLAPSLAAACAEVGNPRVRNVATLGGNLAEADYASDPPAVLASLGAEVQVTGPQGSRTVPADGFVTGFYQTILDDTEIITRLDVPVVPGRLAVYRKYRSRSSEDRACVGVAVRADLSDGGVTALDVQVAAVASTPQRVPSALEASVGQMLTSDVAARIATDYAEGVDPIDDARGSAWYRRRMIQVQVRRALEDLHTQHRQETSNDGH